MSLNCSFIMKEIQIINNKGIVTAHENGVEFETKDLKQTVKKFIENIKNRYPGYNITYSEVLQEIETEEIEIPKVSGNYFTRFIDRYTQGSTKEQLDDSDLSKGRLVSAGILGTNVIISTTVGLLIGKTLLTGIAIGIGSSIVLDIATHKPKEMLIKKVIINSYKQ